MKKIDIGQAIGILANLGVIASLIFVGIQVRQEAAASRAATVQALKQSWVRLNLESATSPELAAARVSIEQTGWSNADAEAKSMMTGFWLALFHNWSNAYYQFRNGTLDQDQWEAHLRDMQNNARSEFEFMRQFWPEWRHSFDEPFAQLMDELIAQSR